MTVWSSLRRWRRSHEDLDEEMRAHALALGAFAALALAISFAGLYHRTREELMKQFGGVRISYGPWKVSGNKLIRTRTGSEEPAKEGTDTVEEFRIEGDVLILQNQESRRARFRRMK